MGGSVSDGPTSAGAQPSLSVYDPPLREQLAWMIANQAAKMGAGRYLQQDIAQKTGNVLDMVPFLGSMIGADDTKRAYDAGNYGSAAVNAGSTALGLLPGGGITSGVAHAIFGGLAAKTADKALLKTAEEMAAKGANRADIWNATGWFKGPDNKWRFEIDDSASQYSGLNPEPLLTPIRAAMKHPDLYQAYPDSVLIAARKQTLGNGMRGYYSPVDDRIGIASSAEEPHSTLLHELQHAVQTREGFARGASPTEYVSGAMFHDKARSLQGALSQELTGGLTYKPQDIARDIKYADPARVQAIVKAHGFSSVDDALAFLKQQDEMRTPISQYRRTAGEVEARNVQTRMNMTPEQRRATPPWLTQDVPDELQIVRFRKDGQ